MNAAEPGGKPPLARASVVVRHGKIWLVPTITSALVALFLTLLYVGGILNPNGNLHHLPVALVNTDQGPPLKGQRQPLGEQLSRSIVAATPADTVRWRHLNQAQMEDQLASGKIYGALVIPPDFTVSVGALTTPRATARPVLTILTNPGLGSFGSSLAGQISQGAARQASLAIGRRLTTQAAANGAAPTARALLGDPITVTTRVGHPIGEHSGLGLTAFYYTLLLVLTAFVGGNIINSGVDAGLGYTDSEIGPWYTRNPTVPISRRQTLLLKMFMTAGITVLTTSLLMIASIAILGMDATHLPLLWIFSFCASLAVGLGVQAINAAFGGIGQVVSMFVFVALALPSSGATIPLEAVPDFYRFLALFEPMRQLSDGVRAILYFDARSDAGLNRGWGMIAIGIALALLFGFAMTFYYDRKGLERAAPQPTSTPRQSP
ncbi:YhgE/Pip domain-containing protein [Streptomyces sp. NPDC001822]|uniref:YhgE/Pip domain-containing protein n=1 Tax=Streptomyces sp. NPDC001822 TaxID=3364614 RepID=UPI003692B7CC